MKSKGFKIIKSRKGISPILATLLLIVIAVAAISVTYAWIMTYMGNTTDKAGVMLYEANVNFITSPNSTAIDIGNSGTTAASIISVYAGRSESAMTPYAVTYTSGYSATVSANAITRFTLTSFTWNNTATFYFKVVPSSGNPLTFSQKAP